MYMREAQAKQTRTWLGQSKILSRQSDRTRTVGTNDGYTAAHVDADIKARQTKVVTPRVLEVRINKLLARVHACSATVYTHSAW